MRAIGLDIGDYSVKLVELVQNKKNVLINQIQEKKLTPNISQEDKELEVIEFVRSFLTTGDFSQTRWVVSVRQDQVTTRFKNFPFSDRLKIQKSLPFEMEEDIPFDTDDCIFDSKLVQSQGTTSDVLATAIPKRHIEKLVSLASNFGIDVYAVSIEGLAFANLVEDWESQPPKLPAPDLSLGEQQAPRRNVQIVLNIGHKKTLFTAYENNRLIFTRSLYWGAIQLINEIIQKHEISYVEAVNILHTQAVVLLNRENTTFEQTQLSNMITKSLRELTRDLQMTILELQSGFNANVTALHYTGGASLIQNIGGYLTQNLEIPCNPINLLQNYSASIAAVSTPQQMLEIEARFNLATALAIEAYKKPRNPATNLLKGEFAKQNENLKVFWELWGSVVQIGVTALVVLFVWTYFRGNFAEQLVAKVDDAITLQAKNVARLPKKQANENGIRKYIKENKKKAAELKLVGQVAGMTSALDILKKVSEAAPEKSQSKIDVLTFMVKDDFVQILGYANSPREIALLTDNLKSISTDGNVNSEQPRLTPVANRVAFHLSFKADRGLVK